MSYNTKVYRQQGGDTLVIEDDGVVEVDGTEYTGAELKALLAIINAIPDSDQEDSSTIWNDGGVLKVSGAG